ncbi:MAG: permease-like cell division protein FtsX [Candidatus Berkelbacteria bacterium]
MLLISIYRILKTSMLSLWRSRWLALASTIMMFLTLFTISFFVSLLIITNKTNENLRDKVDIIVYFKSDATDDQVLALKNLLLTRSDVKTVKYVSKEDALVSWQEMWKSYQKDDQAESVVSSEFNPLPRSIEIKTEQLQNVDGVYNFVNTQANAPIISSISYEQNKKVVDRLLKLSSFVKILGWTLSSIFVLISVVIIYNTISLAIYARSEEIEIMKLVGASSLYIQGPFFVEGVVYAILGSILTGTVLLSVLKLILPTVEKYLEVSNLNSNYLGLNIWYIIGFEFLVGLLLGIICSLLAVRQHLKEKK